MHHIPKAQDLVILLVHYDGTSTLVGEEWLVNQFVFYSSRDEVEAMRDMARACLHGYRRIEHLEAGEAGILRCIETAAARAQARYEARIAEIYRRNPVGGKRRPYRYFRHPKTLAELRENGSWLLIGRLEGEPPPRKARTRGQLPTARDDNSRGTTRSWKSHRRDQWRKLADKRLK